MEVLALTLGLLDETATEFYGEKISHLHHAIQTYYHLRDEDREIRVAGFWHDIGHSFSVYSDTKDTARAKDKRSMLHNLNTMKAEDGTVLGIMDHDGIAKRLFTNALPEKVCDLIGMHTRAKRYQATKDKLSAASRITYELEGGDMTPEERLAFEAEPLFKEALILRAADDAGKDTEFTEPYEMWLLKALLDTTKLLKY